MEGEAVLDIDMIMGINPSVSEIRVYEDSIDIFPTALVDALTQIADDKKVSVVSISYGDDEYNQGSAAMEAENTALGQLTGEGITILASSGDQGAYGRGPNGPYNVEDPSSQPFVTGVGGTTLFTDGNSNYEGEQVWNELASFAGATGGGISSYWTIPFFQSSESISNYVTQNGGSSTYRNVPDVSAVADLFTGVSVYSKINGGWLIIGGTSVSAPIWAGYVTLMNAGLHYLGLKDVGYFNSLLYAVGGINATAAAETLLLSYSISSKVPTAFLQIYLSEIRDLVLEPGTITVPVTARCGDQTSSRNWRTFTSEVISTESAI